MTGQVPYDFKALERNQGKVKITYPSNISKNAQSFIKLALVLDSNKRASAKQLLDHAFIKQATDTKVNSDDVKEAFLNI